MTYNTPCSVSDKGEAVFKVSKEEEGKVLD